MAIGEEHQVSRAVVGREVEGGVVGDVGPGRVGLGHQRLLADGRAADRVGVFDQPRQRPEVPVLGDLSGRLVGLVADRETSTLER